MDLGSVRGLYFPPRGLNKPGRVAEPRWSLASWTKHPAGVMLRINWQCPISASFKQQAASFKQQAASLTNKDYRIIKDL